jgi:hypothetical protein
MTSEHILSAARSRVYRVVSYKGSARMPSLELWISCKLRVQVLKKAA